MGPRRIYRACRRAGGTPRGMVDCMTAAVALRNRARLLTADSDLEQMARVMSIDLENV
jgi:predicted nucleic acid-binding protein